MVEYKSETGENVSDRMAEIVNKSLQTISDENELQELLEKHKRPANLEDMQLQILDQFLWRDLPIAMWSFNDQCTNEQQNTRQKYTVGTILETISR